MSTHNPDPGEHTPSLPGMENKPVRSPFQTVKTSVRTDEARQPKTGPGMQGIPIPNTPFVDLGTLRKDEQPSRPGGGHATQRGEAPGAADPEAGPTWRDAISLGTVNSHQLRNMPLKTRALLLGDWFCEGDLGFIYAPRGVGKTWLALLFARAISEGSSAGCWDAPGKAKVLYVDGEMPPDLIRQRDIGLERTNGEIEFLNHEILFERTSKVLNITRPEVQQAITGYCEAVGTKLLVLDNLSTLASGMKENDADDWELVNNWLLDFRRKRIAVILVHHAGRNGEMRGTSKREDAAFWVIALEDAKARNSGGASGEGDGARFRTRFTKPSRNTAREIPSYEWHVLTNAETGETMVTHCEVTVSGNSQFRRLISEGVVECSQLAEELGVSQATISKWAHKAIKEGWLRKDGREYVLVKQKKGNEE